MTGLPKYQLDITSVSGKDALMGTSTQPAVMETDQPDDESAISWFAEQIKTLCPKASMVTGRVWQDDRRVGSDIQDTRNRGDAAYVLTALALAD